MNKCIECKYCSDVKLNVLGWYICLHPKTFCLYTGPETNRNCIYFSDVSEINAIWEKLEKGDIVSLSGALGTGKLIKDHENHN